MDKVSLHSKSNTSLTLDPSMYPKDLDPFGDDDDSELSETSKEVKISVPVEPSYPGTLDPFADDENAKDNAGVKSISRKSNHHETEFNSPGNNTNVINRQSSRLSRTSNYDESLDPFGDDEGIAKVNNRKSIGTSKEMRKPAIILASSENSASNVNDNLSCKSETESSSSGELVKRGDEERKSFSNQNSPVPVPPRRKHRNVSPSTKSLNRVSYSASSLEREPKNGISSPISQNPDRLSTGETDSYLSHSISNLSIRSISPVTTVRSSPIRSRKKRRAPEPPGTSPSCSAISPVPSNTSIVTEKDMSIDSTVEVANDSLIESANDPINKSNNQSVSQITPTKPTSEPVDGQIPKPDEIATAGPIDGQTSGSDKEPISENIPEPNEETTSDLKDGQTLDSESQPVSESIKTQSSEPENGDMSELDVETTKSDFEAEVINEAANEPTTDSLKQKPDHNIQQNSTVSL